MTDRQTGARRGGPRAGDGAIRTEYLRLRGALHDPSTGLDSAPAEMEAIRALFHKAKSVGLIHLEIDPVARVETVYGWQAFDQMLRAVARELEWLKQTVLPAESVVCQSGVGSDRFLIFAPLPHRGPGGEDGALATACRSLADRLGVRFGGSDFRAMSPKPTFSIGMATLSEHPFYRLERQIDRAIDEARTAAARGEAQDRARQQSELKRILRDGQIEILFQPILHLASRRVMGYEALARGPRDSIFESPSALFEGSREVGMASELDLLCQRAALKQARRLAAGDVLFLNALPASLGDPGFREGLLAELPDDYPIARKDIVLEIVNRGSTHHQHVQHARHDQVDPEILTSELDELRARGFRVSIDDVGRGSASLEGIRESHPDFIKLDDSIVRNIHKNQLKQELARSVCALAREIDAEVIAEGVETAPELATLMRCGAIYAQGYLFYKPSRHLPASKLETQRGGS